ncbi:hypothetical protein [uncultured Brachyspira sp.]|uniref:hypothetical protein n=1 Tax=uncultured Brachyspira sp. TaxID=221953 RepID=UPI00263A307D|nr:hypothetical protein [uncultured Brachyspira sp.]
MIPTEEELENKRKADKKRTLYNALTSYKDKVLKTIEKEKKQAEKSSQKLKEILANNPTKAQRTTATARCEIKWEYIGELENTVELLDELIKESSRLRGKKTNDNCFYLWQ